LHEGADETLEIAGAGLAVLVLATEDPDVHSGTDELQDPPRRHHLDRRHPKHQPGLPNQGHRLSVATDDRDADDGPVPPGDRAKNCGSGAQSFELGARKHERGVPTASHTCPAARAAIAVDDHSTALLTQRPVRAG
jgi:hypothetical protein